jgi:hypothetical protein
MYRIILRWDEVPPEKGARAAVAIANDFRERPWHKNVICTWDEKTYSLVLQAENDFDDKGLALMDEFSDEISACVKDAGDGNISVVSISKIDA